MKIDVDYVVMNNDFDVYLSQRKIVKDKLTLNNIEFSNNMISYNNKKLCFNVNSYCDYNYITYNIDSNLVIYEDGKKKNEYVIENNSYKFFKVN